MFGFTYAQTPSEQVEAYVMVVKAQQAEQKGNITEAIDFYSKALEGYRRVAERHPLWRPDLVHYRMTDCLNQIARLENTPQAGKDSARDQESQITPVAPESHVHDWLEEKTMLEDQLDQMDRDRNGLIETNKDLMAKLEDVENRLSMQQAEVLLSAEYRALMEQWVAATNQIAQVQQQLSVAEKQLAEMEKVRQAERRQLLEQITALKQTIDIDKAEMQKVDALKSIIRELDQENKRQAREIDRLQR